MYLNSSNDRFYVICVCREQRLLDIPKKGESDWEKWFLDHGN